MNKFKKVLIVGLGCFIGLMILMILFLTKIKPGYVGVVYSPNGGIKEQTLKQGWHLVNPFYKITEYTIATEQAYLSRDSKEGSKDDDSFLVPTSDGKVVNVDLEFSYRFEEDSLTALFTRFRGKTGKEIEETFMRGKIKTWASEVSSNFKVIDIFGNKRVELNSEAYKHIKKEFEIYGIVIESVNFSRIGLDKDTEKAIQDRVNSEQELEKERIEARKAEVIADKERIEANKRKDVAIIHANAEAESITIKAEAIAEANKIISQSLTNNLIEYERIKKWNGQMPQVSGNTTPIVNLK
ncbi:SPFH domain-containing protein [Cetobacterium sp.]|uniref:prohibitin family protein n=1 Tax=Cetobacterium sp. TaxID=2071632 RepID=UPI003F2B9AB4